MVEVSFSSESCLVFYALCAVCIAQLFCLLCFAVPAAFQWYDWVLFLSLKPYRVYGKTAEPVLSVCLENKEEPEFKGGE